MIIPAELVAAIRVHHHALIPGAQVHALVRLLVLSHAHVTGLRYPAVLGAGVADRKFVVVGLSLLLQHLGVSNGRFCLIGMHEVCI